MHLGDFEVGRIIQYFKHFYKCLNVTGEAKHIGKGPYSLIRSSALSDRIVQRNQVKNAKCVMVRRRGGGGGSLSRGEAAAAPLLTPPVAVCLRSRGAPTGRDDGSRAQTCWTP